MKTQTISSNRITKSHSVRSSQAPANVSRFECNETPSVAVSNRECGAILRQAQEIQASWSPAERDERAQLGAQRRAELCQLLFGAN